MFLHHRVCVTEILLELFFFFNLVGAGPHTAVFFFVLSWTTLVYSVERIWVYVTTGVRVSKKRDLIMHGIIAILFFVALGFNIWGKLIPLDIYKVFFRLYSM